MSSAYIVHPVLTGRAFSTSSGKSEISQERSPESALSEAVGLAAAIDLEIAGAEIVTMSAPRPATFFTSGRLEALLATFDAEDCRPDLLIANVTLTPVQHRNLEKELSVKVLDRTALILEIFGARAQTAEGRLQVDLAHLTYQRSRLVRSWTHLERQRGGAGFLGGPGERQIESDRRVLSDKIVRLKRKLDDVRRTRTLQRAKRKRAPQPVIALVGYTNAGKSTLFNAITNSRVQAEDLLFATLDPTMRAVKLPSGLDVILSDTVGFVSDLPTHLVAAFRATLEEVLEADLILHVRDIAHEDTTAQKRDVEAVLTDLGVFDEKRDPPAYIEVLNKIDCLDEEDRLAVQAASRLSRQRNRAEPGDPMRIAVSAQTGEGLDALLSAADDVLTSDHDVYVAAIPLHSGAAQAWLHAHGDVLDVQEVGDMAQYRVRLSRKSAGQFEAQFGLPMAIVDDGLGDANSARASR